MRMKNVSQDHILHEFIPKIIKLKNISDYNTIETFINMKHVIEEYAKVKVVDGESSKKVII